tara:strand:- start:1117 stop:1416 length:300 start_codon:yes stop_codon:yes gene_type:complete
MTAKHSLLFETLEEIIKLLADKSIAPLIKSKDLGTTVVEFCNLVKAYGTSQGSDAFGEGSDDTLNEILQGINQHLATFNEHNLIELKKLDFVKNIKPKT